MAGDGDADERGVRDRDVDVAQPPQLAKSVEHHVPKVVAPPAVDDSNQRMRSQIGAAPPRSTALAEAAPVA